jgi:hypothetical protein
MALVFTFKTLMKYPKGEDTTNRIWETDHGLTFFKFMGFVELM